MEDYSKGVTHRIVTKVKLDIAAKRHKIHKKNNLYIGISNSYGRQNINLDFLQDHQT
jgi:hypothetical protein